MAETLYATSHITGSASTPAAATGAPNGATTTDSGNVTWTSRWAIGDPSGSLSGTQSITVRAREAGGSSAGAKITVTLFENGASVATLVSGATLTGGTALTDYGPYTFDGSLISNSANVEIEISAATSGGGPSTRRTAQIDSITLTAEVALPTTPVSQSWSTSWLALAAVSDALQSSWNVAEAPVVNLLTFEQATGLEGNSNPLSSFYRHSTTTISASTDFAASGSRSLKVDVPGGNTQRVSISTFEPNVTGIVEGNTYTATFKIRAAAGNNASDNTDFVAYLWWYNSSGGAIATDIGDGQLMTATSDGWVQCKSTSVAPAGAAQARVLIYRNPNCIDPATYYVDEVGLWEGSSATWLAPASAFTAYANTAEGGSDGVTATTANTGGASGDAFTVAGAGAPTFATAAAHSGSLGYSIPSGSAAGTLEWVSPTADPSASVSFWFNTAGTPAADIRVFAFRNSTPSNIGGLLLSTSRRLRPMVNTSGYAVGGMESPVLTAGEWYLVQLGFKAASVAADGLLDFKIFDSTLTAVHSYQDVLPAANTASPATIERVWFGRPLTSDYLGATYFDDIRFEGGRATTISEAVVAPVSASRSTLWNVAVSSLTSVSGSLASSWNTRSQVSASRATSWNDSETVARAANTSWSIRSLVGTAINTGWAVRSAVTAARSTAWNTLKVVTDSVVTSWGVRRVVTAARSTSWNVAGFLDSVSRAVSSSWNVVGRISSARSTSWHDLETVSDPLASSWGVRELISAQRSTRWNALAQIAQAKAASWNVRRVVGQVRSTSWHDRAAVLAQRSTRWNVDGFLGAVSRAIETSWHTVGRIAASRATSWHDLETVGTQRSTRWNVLIAVTRARATSWNVLTRTTASVKAASWNVLAHASASMSTRWNLSGPVGRAVSASWHVVGTVGGSVSTAWNTLYGLVTPTILKPKAFIKGTASKATIKQNERSDARIVRNSE